VLVLVGGAGGLAALVELGHELDSRGDVDVALARFHVVGRDPDGLQAGGAVARDRAAADLQRQPLREQGDDSAHVEGLLALGHTAAGDDLLDQRRIHAGVCLEQPIDDQRAHLVRAHLGQRALEGATDGSADGVDDHCFGHASRLLWLDGGGRAGRRKG